MIDCYQVLEITGTKRGIPEDLKSLLVIYI